MSYHDVELQRAYLAVEVGQACKRLDRAQARLLEALGDDDSVEAAILRSACGHAVSAAAAADLARRELERAHLHTQAGGKAV